MAERKAVNKYYPPDWDPAKGSVNKHVGQHPLRERAKKLSQGILIIRFEMPYNIWCNGCGNHIGMGVRYNAEKKKVGNYYTTPIYRFRMKCHLCDNYMEIETDPKNCEYTIVSGARRKEERWDASATENIEATDHAEKQKLIDDAMYKLEHGEKDKRKSKAAIPGLAQIKDIQLQWKDDFALNQMLRKKFRQEKKLILENKEKDQELKDKGSLGIELLSEDLDDIKMAKKIKFHSSGFQEDQRKKRLEIKSRPMFKDEDMSVKNAKRADLLEKRQKIMITKSIVNSPTTPYGKTGDRLVKKKRKHENTAGLLSRATEIEEPACREELGQLQNSTVINMENKISGDLENDIDGNMTKYETTDDITVRTSKTLTIETVDTCNKDRTNDKPEQSVPTVKGQKISLVSEIYSDTDSDNSK